MTDRLTYSESRSSRDWSELAIPASLLMVVIRESWISASYMTRGLHLGLWALFSLQTAILVRGMLPKKAPAPHKALAGCLGALTVSWIISVEIVTPSIAWILAVSAWNFFHDFDESSIPPRILSGLCIGTALSLAPETMAIALPLMVLNGINNLKKNNGIRIASAQWELGLLLGLIPYILGRIPLPRFIFSVDRIGMVNEFWNYTFSHIALYIWPVLALGMVVSCLHAKRTCFGFLVPIHFITPIYQCFFYSRPLFPIWMTVVGIWTAYGVYRVAKGVEQGIRASNPKAATNVINGCIFAVLIAYAIWAGLQIHTAL